MRTPIPISHQQAQYFFDYPKDGPPLGDFRDYQRWNERQQIEQYGIARDLPSRDHQQAGEMVEQLLNIYSPNEKLGYLKAIRKAIPNYQSLHPHLLQNNAGLDEATRADTENKKRNAVGNQLNPGTVNPDLIDPLTGLTKLSYHPNDAGALDPGLAVIKEIDQTAADLGNGASLTEDQKAELMQASLGYRDRPTMAAGYGEHTLQYFENSIPGYFTARAGWLVVKHALGLKQGWQDENEVTETTKQILWTALQGTAAPEGGALDVVKFLSFAFQHAKNMTPQTAGGLTEIWEQLNPRSGTGVDMETFAMTLEERTGVDVLSDDTSSGERWRILLASPAILANDKDWTPEELQELAMKGRAAWNDEFGKWKTMDDLSVRQFVIETLLSEHLSEMLREDIQPHELLGEIETALTQITSRKDLRMFENIRWPWDDLTSEVDYNVLGSLAPGIVHLLEQTGELTPEEAIIYLKLVDEELANQRIYSQVTQSSFLEVIKEDMPELLLAYPKLEGTYLSSFAGIQAFMLGILDENPVNMGRVVDEEGEISYDPYLHKRRVKQLQDIRKQIVEENKHLLLDTEPAKITAAETKIQHQLAGLGEKTTVDADPPNSPIHILWGSLAHETGLKNRNPAHIQAESIGAAMLSSIYTGHMEKLLDKDIPGLLDFPSKDRMPGAVMNIDLASMDHFQRIAVIKTIVNVQEKYKSDSGLINHPIVAQVQEYVAENIDALNVDFMDRITAGEVDEADLETGRQIINTLALVDYLIREGRGRTSVDNVKGVLDIHRADFSAVRLLINLSNAAGITNFTSTTTPAEIQEAFVNLAEMGRRGVDLLVANRGQPQPSPMGSPTGSNMAILRVFARANTIGELEAAMSQTIELTGNKTQADALREIFSDLSWSFPEDKLGWQKAYKDTAPIGATLDKGLHKEVYDSGDKGLLEAGVYQNIAQILLFERGSSNELPLGPLANLVLAGPNTIGPNKTGSLDPWKIDEFTRLVYSTHNTGTGGTPVRSSIRHGQHFTVPPDWHSIIDKLPPPKQAEIDEAGGLFPYILNEENYWNMSVHDLTRPQPPPSTGVINILARSGRPAGTEYGSMPDQPPQLHYNQLTEIVLSHFDLNHPALKDLKVEEVVKGVIRSARKHAFVIKELEKVLDDASAGDPQAMKTIRYIGYHEGSAGSSDDEQVIKSQLDLKIRDLVIETIYRLSPEDAGAKGADGKPVPLPLGFTRGDMGMQVIPAMESKTEKRLLSSIPPGTARWLQNVADQPIHVYGGGENPVRLDVKYLPTNGDPIRIQLNKKDVPYLRFRFRSKEYLDNPKAILLDLDNIGGSDWSKRK